MSIYLTAACEDALHDQCIGTYQWQAENAVALVTVTCACSCHTILALEYGVVAERQLPDSRVIQITPQLFGQARLAIGPKGSTVYDDEWEYPSTLSAINAAGPWDLTQPEPDGWTRHPSTGRRRSHGDASQEYIWK